MINIKALHKHFGDLEVLVGLELEINHEGIFVILGPNGSGKTTLIKCLLGMVIPNSGTIKIDNQNILGEHTYRNEINYLPQIANFPSNLTVDELIKLVIDLRTKDANAKTLIEQFELRPFLNKKLGKLSGGTKQKVNIVLAFMFDSPLIILDEPTTGLDPISLITLKKLIKSEKEKGKTILITTHIMSFVEEISEEIVFLLEGKIYFKGTVEMLKMQTKQNDLEHAIASILKENDV